MPSTGAPLNKALAGALKKAKQLARAEAGASRRARRRWRRRVLASGPGKIQIVLESVYAVGYGSNVARYFFALDLF